MHKKNGEERRCLYPPPSVFARVVEVERGVRVRPRQAGVAVAVRLSEAISLVLDQTATPCLDAGHGVQAERPEMSDMRFYLEELFRFGMELII